MDSGMPTRGLLHLLLHGESGSDDEQQQQQQQQQIKLFGATLSPIASSSQEEPQQQLEQDVVAPSSSSSSSPEMYKVVVIYLKVVGIENFTRKVSECELVTLVRSPIPRDRRILVLTHCRQDQVGFVEPLGSAALGPLMDSNVISTSCVVPAPGYTQGMLEFPCYVHIYSSLDHVTMVRESLFRRGLNLLPSHFSEHFIQPTPWCISSRPVEAVFERLKESLSRKAAPAPLEPPSDIVTAELFPHQKEALGWLMERESSSDLPPFWFEKNGVYINELSGLVNDNCRPEPIRGGIFADECGSGKRLTLISLMAFDKCIVEPWVCDNRDMDDKYEFDEVLEAENDDGDEQPWFNRPGDPNPILSKRPRRETGLGLGNPGVFSIRKRATLVICDSAALSTWHSQMGEYTGRKMKVYIYHGRRTSSVELLKKYDVVLTTYKTLTTESKLDVASSPISRIRWWRVILDGADTLKRVRVRRTEVVINLMAERRWAVTSCPMNKVELRPLLTFLRLHPFYMTRYWRQFIGDHLRNNHPAGVQRLQVVLDSLALIRTKEALNGAGFLSPLFFVTSFVDLSPKERKIYAKACCEIKSRVRRLLIAGIQVNYNLIMSLISRLRKICTDASLSQSDIDSIISPDAQEVSNRAELVQKLLEVLQEGEEIECPICICEPVDAVITLCAHIFCRECIERSLTELNSICPLCRSPVTEAGLIAPAKPAEELAEPLSSLSSKAKQLIRLLDESKAANPSGKSVVFSQFPKVLFSLRQPLVDAGYHVVVADASSSMRAREHAVWMFNQPETRPTVMLASMKSDAAGMDLTAASTVYLLEPWWNPLTEKRAVDRVHRVGQKNPVKVVRLVVKDTIEERVIELLEEKKEDDREQRIGGGGSSYNRSLKTHEVRLLLQF